MSTDVIRCPKCGSDQVHSSESPFKRSFSIGWWLLGGFILSVLHAAGQKRRFLCESYQDLFFTHTRKSKVALFFFVILALFAALGVWSWLSTP